MAVKSSMDSVLPFRIIGVRMAACSANSIIASMGPNKEKKMKACCLKTIIYTVIIILRVHRAEIPRIEERFLEVDVFAGEGSGAAADACNNNSIASILKLTSTTSSLFNRRSCIFPFLF